MISAFEIPQKRYVLGMILFLCLLAISIYSFSATNQVGGEKIKVAVIIGGHDYNKKAFEEMWASFGDISVEYLNYKVGNCKFFDSPPNNKYNVIVFYNMNQQLNEREVKNFLDYLKNGKKMIFLHHAVSAFPKWEEFPRVVGAKYFLEDNTVWEGRAYPRSTYKHDVRVSIKVADKSHRVTEGVEDFEEVDEIYGNYWISSEVKPLLVTDHPDSEKLLAWVNKYLNAEVLFIQPGHGPQIFSNPNYRKLIHNAVVWASK